MGIKNYDYDDVMDKIRQQQQAASFSEKTIFMKDNEEKLKKAKEEMLVSEKADIFDLVDMLKNYSYIDNCKQAVHIIIKEIREKLIETLEEFSRYKQSHKEVSVEEQLKLEIIKSMLASGEKPSNIQPAEVDLLAKRLLGKIE